MKKVIIVCDGACSGNGKETNIGGWGAVLKYGDQSKEICGGAPMTTNNIMELTAAIEALKCLKTPELDIEIYSDSAYVVNCFLQKWYLGWMKNGWRNSKKEPVENQPLWKELIDLVHSFNKVTFFKIKGHLNLNQASDINKWHAKFNLDNKCHISIETFTELVKLNHLADALANQGMTAYR